MRTILLAVVAMTGCGLYAGDDAPDDVDAGSVDSSPPSIAGIYRVEFACVGTCGVNPIGETERVWIIDGDPLEAEWSRFVDPAPRFIHRGAMAADGCAEIAASDDGNMVHDPYRLCSTGADITWSTGTWHVTMTLL